MLPTKLWPPSVNPAVLFNRSGPEPSAWSRATIASLMVNVLPKPAKKMPPPLSAKLKLTVSKLSSTVPEKAVLPPVLLPRKGAVVTRVTPASMPPPVPTPPLFTVRLPVMVESVMVEPGSPRAPMGPVVSSSMPPPVAAALFKKTLLWTVRLPWLFWSAKPPPKPPVALFATVLPVMVTQARLVLDVVAQLPPEPLVGVEQVQALVHPRQVGRLQPRGEFNDVEDGPLQVNVIIFGSHGQQDPAAARGVPGQGLLGPRPAQQGVQEIRASRKCGLPLP